jgi:hypothetical protein
MGMVVVVVAMSRRCCSVEMVNLLFRKIVVLRNNILAAAALIIQDEIRSVEHTANGDQGLDAGDHAASKGSKAGHSVGCF